MALLCQEPLPCLCLPGFVLADEVSAADEKREVAAERADLWVRAAPSVLRMPKIGNIVNHYNEQHFW